MSPMEIAVQELSTPVLVTIAEEYEVARKTRVYEEDSEMRTLARSVGNSERLTDFIAIALCVYREISLRALASGFGGFVA